MRTYQTLFLLIDDYQAPPAHLEQKTSLAAKDLQLMRNLFDKVSQRLTQVSWVGVDVDAVSGCSQMILPPKAPNRNTTSD